MESSRPGVARRVTETTCGPGCSARSIARAKVKLAKAENQKGVMNHTCASLPFEAGASPAYCDESGRPHLQRTSLEVNARKLVRSRDTGEPGPPCGECAL